MKRQDYKTIAKAIRLTATPDDVKERLIENMKRELSQNDPDFIPLAFHRACFFAD